jgi:hypothetical protein
MGDQPIFPGGPLQSQLDEWKARYHGEVYSSTFGDFGEEVYIWRVLWRGEYKEVMKLANADAFFREERICDKCVLWPLGYSAQPKSTGKAGTPSVLAEQILAQSGFNPTAAPQRL